MLSLQGSIQADPFSPEHVPHPDKEAPSPTFHRDETPEVEAQNENGKERDQVEEDQEESDGDGFRHLARLTDEAQANQKAKRAKEEDERLEKAKKRKLRESRSDGKGPRHGKRAEKKRIKEITS